LGRRVALMKDGRVHQLGTPMDLYRRPASTFVAGFLGSPPMNLMDAVAESSSVHAAGVAWDAELPSNASSRALTMGVRPEAIELSAEPRAGWTPARVGVVEALGNETLVTLELPQGRLVARGSGTLAADVDSTIYFSAPREACLFFDRESGALVK
ncbi:MAG TPA: TOBE domain-containing protein, partial [Gemmatimonadaceae bacterium]|nr:TOBE domain-containing protein [Gemmatimonadaceae bacterium]